MFLDVIINVQYIDIKPIIRLSDDADTAVRFDSGKEWLNIHGRLSPGVGREQVSATITATTAQIAKEHPSTNEFKVGSVAPYHAIGALSVSQLAVMKAIGQALMALPLLVVCLNIAGMVQVRSAMRERLS